MKGKRILGVKIQRMYDEDPDTSWIGKFSDTAETEFAIDHRERSGEDPRVYRYFNPGTVTPYTPADGSEDDWRKEMQRYAEMDYKRIMELERGAFCFLGVRAVAEVQFEPNGPIQKLTSGGLWGIESDSEDSHFEEVGREELADLKTTLYAAGFSKRAVSKACEGLELCPEVSG